MDEKAVIDEMNVRVERTQDDLISTFWPLVRKFFPEAVTAVLMVGERSDFPVPEGQFPLAVATLILGSQNIHDDCLKAVALDVSRTGQALLEREAGPKMQ